MSDIVERLRKGIEWTGPTQDDTGQTENLMDEAADIITALRAREADLTLEGLAHIGRLEAVREVLAGTDIGSLPKDYPTLQMAQDRMAELAALHARVEKLEGALVHNEAAYRLLAGTTYRVKDDGSMELQDHFCTIAEDLHRIDRAIGAAGGTPFAQMADAIQAVFVELIAARAALGDTHE